jgi:hypothetical protein
MKMQNPLLLNNGIQGFPLLCINHLGHISERMTYGTMTSAHISATTICVMWRKEHDWNVSVLQRENLYKCH